MGIQERKEREKEVRRKQILASAKRVFSAKGFNKATMEDIAGEAELSPGTLYLYFKNKDELYATLSLQMLLYLNSKLDGLYEGQPPGQPLEKLDALKDVLFEVYEFDPLVLINMFHLQSSETLKNLSIELISEFKEQSRKALGLIARVFKEGMDAGVIVRRHPVELADILWSLFAGVILWEESKKIVNGEKDYLKSTLDTAFEIFCRGIVSS